MLAIGPADEPAQIDEGDDGVGLVDLMTWLGRGKWRIAAAAAVTTALAFGYAATLPKIYTARTTLLPPGSQQQNSSAAALAAIGSLGGVGGSLVSKTPDELYVALLRSDSVQRSLIDRFNLRERYKIPTYEAIRRALPSHIRVASDKKSGLISVEVDDEEPAFAADLANAHTG